MNSLLKTLVKFKTITSDLETNVECLKWCQGYLKNRDIDSQILNTFSRPLLVWGSKLEKCHILLNSHLDVVPGSDKIFNPVIKGSRMYGRGVADTKSSVSALLALPQLPPEVTCALVTDEEIGGDSTRQMIEISPNLEFAIFCEPTDLHIINQAKGIMQIKISAFGKSAHGSKPWLGTNAINLLASKLDLFLKNHPLPISETNSTTYNFSQISGGKAINQIPDLAELWLDVRYNPKDSIKKILQDIKRHFRPCQIDIIKLESTINTSPNSHWAQSFAQSLKANNLPISYRFDHGSSDARHCTAKNIPALVFGPIGGNIHQEDEWVDIQSVTKAKAVLESFLWTK